MPWWSWILIWGVLVLALLGMLAWLGYRLFTKAGRVLAALGDLADMTSILESRAEDLTPARFRPAVLENRAQWVRVRGQHQADRERRKNIRREIRLRRGKLLVKADPQQFSSLVKRT